MEINSSWRAETYANWHTIHAVNIVPERFLPGGLIYLGHGSQAKGPGHIIKTVAPTTDTSAHIRFEGNVEESAMNVPFVYAPEGAMSAAARKLIEAVNALDRATGDRTSLTGGSKVISLDKDAPADVGRYEFRTAGQLRFAIEQKQIGGVEHLVFVRFADGNTPADEIKIPLAAASALGLLGGLTPAADRLPYFSGAGSAALATLSAYMRSLFASADAAAARSGLLLGDMAVQSTANYVPKSGGDFSGIVRARGAGQGAAALVPAGDRPGYLALYTPADVRAAFIGFGDAANLLDIATEAGYRFRSTRCRRSTTATALSRTDRQAVIQVSRPLPRSSSTSSRMTAALLQTRASRPRSPASTTFIRR